MNRNAVVNYILTGVASIAVIGILIYEASNSPLDARLCIGAILTIVSLVFLIIARIQIGGSFTLRPRANALVTTGIYSKIRHPIYVFAQSLILGIILCIRIDWFILIWALIFIMQIKRAKMEERVLEEKFGETYRQYRKTTWF